MNTEIILIRVISLIGDKPLKVDAISKWIDYILNAPDNEIDLTADEKSFVYEELLAYAKTEKGKVTEIYDKDHTFWWKAAKQSRLNAPSGKVDGSGKGYWNRYLWKLMEDKFPYSDLDTFTDRILDFCEDPLKEGKWDRRGLVVGHVQSGKTANYVGLINKAVDAGYKLIIVIAGIHNNLRNQTQERIEKDFIGKSTRDRKTIGVHKFNRKFNVDSNLPFPTTLTSFERDFNKTQRNSTLIDLRNSNAPTVLIVKKNVSVLNSIISWLSNEVTREMDGIQRIEALPMLVIDDEADNASLNTNKPETDPTTINRLIRILLNLFEQKSFIGYTATPYANIFVPEVNNQSKEFELDGRRYELGDELFPKDFIVNIKPGSNYFGAARIFGSADLDGSTEELNLLREIEDQNESSAFPTKISKDNKYDLPEELPNSLKQAIKSHFIAAAIKLMRGDLKKHCSMMIHVSHLVLWMDRVAALTEKEVNYYRNLVRNEDHDFLSELEKLFMSDFYTTTDEAIEIFKEGEEPRIIRASWNDIKPFLKSAADRFEVFSVHGTKKREKKVYTENGQYTEEGSGKKYDIYMLEHSNSGPFDYNDPRYKNGLFAIAVGGNRLSRGLTIEGLTTTYYLRVSKLYDTLMQMGRWFGYRPGYIDLCRIYTTRDLIGYYRHIVHATDKMRGDFDDMAAAGKSPSDFQLKVMTHPSFLSITSAGKMRDKQTHKVKFSGDHKTTYEISKKQESIDSNFEELKSFLHSLKDIEFRKKSGLNYKQGEFGFQVADFIKGYFTDQLSMNTEVLSRYIKEITEAKLVTNWTVAVADNSNKTVDIIIDGKSVNEDVLTVQINSGGLMNTNAVVRNEPVNNTSSEDYIIRKQQIISPTHAYFDLEITDEEFEANQKAKNKKRFLVKEKRKEINTALLVIYLLDPRAVKDVSNDKPIVGFYLDFPEIENELAVEYAVNSRKSDDEDYEAADDDEFEGENED